MSESKAVNQRLGDEVQGSNSQSGPLATQSTHQKRRQVNQHGQVVEHIDDSYLVDTQHLEMSGYSGGRNATVVPVSNHEIVQNPHSRHGSAAPSRGNQQQRGSVAHTNGNHRQGHHPQRAAAPAQATHHSRVSWSDEQGYPLTQVSTVLKLNTARRLPVSFLTSVFQICVPLKLPHGHLRSCFTS